MSTVQPEAEALCIHRELLRSAVDSFNRNLWHVSWCNYCVLMRVWVFGEGLLLKWTLRSSGY